LFIPAKNIQKEILCNFSSVFRLKHNFSRETQRPEGQSTFYLRKRAFTLFLWFRIFLENFQEKFDGQFSTFNIPAQIDDLRLNSMQLN
jgi:hypothetical protein